MIGARDTQMALPTYVSVLLMFRALHCASDNWRRRFAEACLCHGVPSEYPGLVDVIDRDLAALGVQAVSSKMATVAFNHNMDFSMVLGGLYVVAGSALGNTLMLRQIRASCDTAFDGATAFLSASAGDAGPAFQALRNRIDDFGLAFPAAQNSVVEGARRTFLACATTFRSLHA